jgi:predicted lipase
LIKTLDKFIADNDNFVLGGHSLGGACAILCASYIQDQKNKNVEKVFTFGVPRLASKQFQTFYRQQKLWHKTQNYIITKDPVTKLPVYRLVGNIVEFRNFEGNGFLENHDLNSYLEVISNFDR